jgi:hypothetical protein
MYLLLTTVDGERVVASRELAISRGTAAPRAEAGSCPR